MSNTGKTKNGLYLGLRGSKPTSEGTYSTEGTHFLLFPGLGIAQRDPYTPVPVVTSCSRRAAQSAHCWGQRWGSVWAWVGMGIILWGGKGPPTQNKTLPSGWV